MSENVSQWLEEIQSLKQEIARIQQERSTAEASGDRWRSLYNTEAQQRRIEAQQHEAAIAELRSQIERLQQQRQVTPTSEVTPAEFQQQFADLGMDELKAKLIEASRERGAIAIELARVAKALDAEKAAHEQTRQTLTSALADTVQLLKKPQPQGKQSGVSFEVARFASGIPQVGEKKD